MRHFRLPFLLISLSTGIGNADAFQPYHHSLPKKCPLATTARQKKRHACLPKLGAANYDASPPPETSEEAKANAKAAAQRAASMKKEKTDYDEKRQQSETLEGFLETIVPPVVPIVAFLTYDEVAFAFQRTIKMVAKNTWLSDGNKEAAVTSALNSIVIPTSAILYATLTATTVNALRQRQQSIREGLNKEASELRILQGLLEYFPETRQDRFRIYMIQYISRVLEECSPETDLETIESKGLESEIDDLLKEVNAMVAQDSPEGERTEEPLIFQSYDALVRLKSGRSDRLSAMQNRLPMLHYVVLFSLAMSITVGFLIETNKAKVDFDAFQLRILWTQLVASFSALGVIVYDLNSAFDGNYQVRCWGKGRNWYSK